MSMLFFSTRHCSNRKLILLTHCSINGRSGVILFVTNCGGAHMQNNKLNTYLIGNNIMVNITDVNSFYVRDGIRI